MLRRFTASLAAVAIGASLVAGVASAAPSAPGPVMVLGPVVSFRAPLPATVTLVRGSSLYDARWEPERAVSSTLMQYYSFQPSPAACASARNWSAWGQWTMTRTDRWTQVPPSGACVKYVVVVRDALGNTATATSGFLFTTPPYVYY
jgi:hypothetical protein